ncbi:MAG: hypothetical protein HDR49_03270 [Bacteroides sp.]|nr:hypothetical protein [Bacteroides sp.]MDE6039297.1 hypothetical protein [Paramuribaculum sp.]
MKLFTKTLFAAALAAVATLAACSMKASVESIESSLREAEDAVAVGDMASAESVASYLTNDPALPGAMTSVQLARLSMVYVQVADSLDQEGNTNRAADFYDMAYKANSDSAEAYYRSVEPSRLQYVETLANHSANRANPVDISNLPDEMSDSLHNEESAS